MHSMFPPHPRLCVAPRWLKLQLTVFLSATHEDNVGAIWGSRKAGSWDSLVDAAAIWPIWVPAVLGLDPAAKLCAFPCRAARSASTGRATTSSRVVWMTWCCWPRSPRKPSWRTSRSALWMITSSYPSEGGEGEKWNCAPRLHQHPQLVNLCMGLGSGSARGMQVVVAAL